MNTEFRRSSDINHWRYFSVYIYIYVYIYIVILNFKLSYFGLEQISYSWIASKIVAVE
jgi:hypothetical protein